MFFLSGYLKGFLALFLGMDTNHITNQEFIILTILSDIILFFLFYLIYRKDLKKEFKTFKDKPLACLDCGLKYWFLGLVIMMITNILITAFTPLNNSTNETTVQSLIPVAPFLMFLTAGVFAPIIEEIAFRKTLKDIFNNKWVFAFCSFLLFGYIHVSGSLSNPFEFLYIIPYGALGYTFARAYSETDTVFTSILMHAIHNSILIILSIIN